MGELIAVTSPSYEGSKGGKGEGVLLWSHCCRGARLFAEGASFRFKVAHVFVHDPREQVDLMLSFSLIGHAVGRHSFPGSARKSGPLLLLFETWFHWRGGVPLLSPMTCSYCLRGRSLCQPRTHTDRV